MPDVFMDLREPFSKHRVRRGCVGYMMPLSYLISDQSLTYWEKLAFGPEPGLSKWPVELGRCKKVCAGKDVIKI